MGHRLEAQRINDLLGVPIKVLDDGYVRLVDYMGNDASVVEAARVSYGAGTKQVRDDRSLIRYLLRHHHTTPFEMCEIKLHLRVPMDAWRQWIRHRTASVNEYSTRYSIAIDAAQRTSQDRWRLQASHNKQGSEGFIGSEIGERLSAEEIDFQERARRVYQHRLDVGVAREQARKDLPLSTYTEAFWKIDLHNLLHFLRLRMDENAQFEIRTYADVIGNELVSKWVPLVWEAFLDYDIESLQLTRFEVEIVSLLIRGLVDEALNKAKEHKLVTTGESGQLILNREARELESKLTRLGLSIPWS
jgi:thymidylate synthase (FAD)